MKQRQIIFGFFEMELETGIGRGNDAASPLSSGGRTNSARSNRACFYRLIRGLGLRHIKFKRPNIEGGSEQVVRDLKALQLF